MGQADQVPDRRANRSCTRSAVPTFTHPARSGRTKSGNKGYVPLSEHLLPRPSWAAGAVMFAASAAAILLTGGHAHAATTPTAGSQRIAALTAETSD